MPIKLRCTCGKWLKVSDSAAGKVVKCPGCGSPIEVPLEAQVLDEDFEPRRLPVASANAEGAPKCVLTIADDPDLVATVVAILKGMGIRAIGATSAAGLVMARERGPDLIVLDVSATQANGFDIYHELQAVGASGGSQAPRPAVIVLTSRTKDEDHERAQAMGADGCFRKPIRPKVLCREIAQVLQGRSKENVKQSG